MAIINQTAYHNDGGSKAKTANLRYGSTGNDVKALQQQLQAAGYDIGKSGADGVYGSATAAAVKQFQKDNGLAVDGVAGANTQTALKRTGGSSSSSSSSSVGPNVNMVLSAGALTGAQIAAGTKTAPSATKPTTPTAKQPAATQPTAKQPAATTPAASTPAASTPEATNEPTKKAPAQFTYDDFSYGDFAYGSYAESDIVQQANALLQQQNAAKPGAYQSQWQDEINDYLGQIQNRGPFSYDLNSDALYQQYKNNYIQQGQMAMMDTMGQAAAMAGGYGNSYAQTVGQQAYNQQLNQLNNVMPQLYQMAFDRYAYEGDQLQNMYNMYLGLEEHDYGRYMDNFNAWQEERDYLASRYDAERALDYSRYESERSLAYDQYSADRELAYDQYTTGKDQAWKEYLANQEKEQAAAELMAGTGNYDRLGDVYGLTDEEVAAIKKANTPKATGGVQPKNDKSLTLDQIGSLQDLYKHTEGVDAADFASYYGTILGVDPSQVYGALGVAGLTGGDDDIIDPPPVDEPDDPPKRKVGTPGGGNFYYEKW